MPRGESDKRRLLVTVLFTDIVGSTALAEQLGDKRWREVLTRHHRMVRRALRRHGGREVDTAGDGFFARFDQPSAAIDCAIEMIDELRAAGIAIRAGVHMGEVEVIGDKVGGIAVHVGARVMTEAHAGELLVSATVRDLMAGSDYRFEDVGFRDLKGVSASVHLYAVEQDDATAERPTPGPQAGEDSPRRAPTPWLATGAVVVLAAVAAAFLALRGSGPAFSPAPNTVVQLDERTGEISGGVAVGTTPTNVAFGEGALWVANFDNKTIQRVDVADRIAMPAEGGVSSTPTGLAVGGGYVWVTNGFARTLVRIDPTEPNAVKTFEIASSLKGVAFGEGAVWVADANDGQVVRLDPVTGDLTRVSLPKGAQPGDVAVGAASVWVTDELGGRVFRIDAASLDVSDVYTLLEGAPARIAFGDGRVWVTSTDADTLTRFVASTGQARTVEHVGNGPLGVAASADAVWVANSLDGTVVRIDPTTASIEGRTRIGFSPDGVAVTPDGVWVSVHSL
jgi:class 3 adenylate cyclase/DNA-binding beta-propeller fold protein YncE